MLFQGGGLIRQLSAMENVLCGRLGTRTTWQTLLGFPKRDRLLALELLEQLGLKELADQKTSQLSGGQQQRVAIARALIQSPQILLADEPITGLDVVASQQVMQTLSESAHPARHDYCGGVARFGDSCKICRASDRFRCWTYRL